MKARPVAGLDAHADLAQAARLIISVRAEELFAFAPRALEPQNSKALHDMRIAAKRLRYVLELVGFCVPTIAAEAELAARELQSLIGDIHDHDVLLERISATGALAKKGMRRLAERVQARRDARFAEFTTLWRALEASDVRGRIVAATSYSTNGAGSSA
jgi:CHAD domain-containing protein